MERKPVRVLVKNQEWQKVRKDLIGKWKSDPISCCKKLRSFLGLSFPYVSVGTGGVPTYQFSYRTLEATTKRVALT